MKPRRNHLRLVSFSPEDYSLGSSLLGPDREQVEDPDQVGSALSLFFQWPEYRQAIATAWGQVQDVHAVCDIDFDHDEREPSELYITFLDRSVIPQPNVGDTITVFLEVFKTAFQIQVVVTAVDEKSSGALGLVVLPPRQVLIFKKRRLPRVNTSDLWHQHFPEVFCTFSNGRTERLTVLQIGMGSAVVEPALPLGEGAIDFNSKTGHSERFTFQVVRSNEAHSVLKLSFQTGEMSGIFFDIYRLAAYPCLSSRSSVRSVDLINLFRETAYFSKFETNETPESRTSLILESWDAIEESNHKLTADYVALSDGGNLSGSSSLALAFLGSDGREFWAFHQLCARTSPSLLEQSGSLYIWRAEYLASRPEELSAVVWFDSRSRWLERIYVKFASLSREKEDRRCRLYPVSVFRRVVLGKTHDVQSASVFNFGTAKRAVASSGQSIAGIGPRFLNASGILDAVVNLSGEASNVDLTSVAETAVSLLNESARVLEFTVPAGVNDIENAERLEDVDRFLTIPKNLLPDFIASVEHSLAVTRRKLSRPNGK